MKVLKLIVAFFLCKVFLYAKAVETNHQKVATEGPLKYEPLENCSIVQENKMVKECMTKSNIEFHNTMGVDEILCYVYLENLVKFMKIINECNVSLIFPPLTYNMTICQKPEFLLLDNIKLKIEPNIACDKLCVNWTSNIEQKCGLAHYYYNYKIDNIPIMPDKNIEKLSVSMVGTQTAKKMPSLPRLQNDVKSKPIQITEEKNVGTYVKMNSTTEDIKPISKVIKPNTDADDKSGKNYEIKINENGTQDKTNIKENVSKDNKTNLNERENKDNKTNINEIGTNDIKTVINENSNKDNNSNINGFGSKEKKTEINENVDGISKTQQIFSGEGEDKNLKSDHDVAEDFPANNLSSDVEGQSYFFSYFMVICILFIMGYVLYHNRTKVLAIMLEGKQHKRPHRAKRPNSANYHKLDSNLEEALSSSCSKNSNQIIF